MIEDFIIDVPHWMAAAACIDHDPELFFPEQGGTTRPAKAICDLCPVKAECLDYALRWRIKFGVWGGATTFERSKMRKPPQIVVMPEHGTTARYARGCKCAGCMAANRLAGREREERYRAKRPKKPIVRSADGKFVTNKGLA